MGIRNYLIEGVSCTGKTTICRELQRRGYHAINGDTELACRFPKLAEQRTVNSHFHHVWNADKVRALAADKTDAATFFCGGSRNFLEFIDVFDCVFLLQVDLATLNQRLASRPASEWGGTEAEREFVRCLHATQEDVPKNGIPIDATAPLDRVVEEILRICQLPSEGPEGPMS